MARQFNRLTCGNSLGGKAILRLRARMTPDARAVQDNRFAIRDPLKAEGVPPRIRGGTPFAFCNYGVITVVGLALYFKYKR